MVQSPVPTLKGRKEISLVFENNINFSSKYFRVFYSKHICDTKVLYVVSKKVGNAVKRNKIRRRLREIMRLNKDILPNRHIVILAYPAIKNASYKEIEITFFNIVNIFNKRNNKLNIE